jgi:hypothetical protein
MKPIRIAGVLSFVIGAMAIVAGSQVLFFGKEMGYHVISWLPSYNFAMGLVTLFVTTILIWKMSRLALPAAVVTFLAHLTVMLVLLVGYRNVAARESLTAMSVRLVVWGIILSLLFFQRKRRRQP